jgi:hypothetical protein
MATPTPTLTPTVTSSTTTVGPTMTITPSTTTVGPSTTSSMSYPSTTSTPYDSNVLANIAPVANTGGIFDGMSYILNSLIKQDGKIDPIKTAELSNELSSLNDSASNVLNNQGTLNNIVKEETTALNNRLQNMNNSVNAAQRNLMLNESARLKSQDYNTIIYYFIGLIIFINMLMVLNRWFPYLSRETIDLIIIFTVFFVLYKIYWKFTDISIRDNINYNEVSLPKPDNVSLSNQQIISQNNINNQQLAGKGMIFNLLNKGTNNNNNNNQCPQITTATPTPTISGFTVMNEIQPNSFNEFENYSKI